MMCRSERRSDQNATNANRNAHNIVEERGVEVNLDHSTTG